MLTPEQIAALEERARKITDPITDFLIEDIARRISEAGQLTSTASYQVWRAQQLGVSQRQVKKELRRRLKVSHRELRKLLTQSAETGYDFDIRHLPYVQAVPFRENEAMQKIVSAAVKLAQKDFTNLTQTLGMIDPYGKALPLQDVYRSCTDYAFKQVITGAADYNTAIRRATRNLAEQGVRTIDYQSGVHTSLEAAVRRNVMGGLGLMQEQISRYDHDALGADGWEISAHAASAPDHEPIQGKQYSDAEYEALNNSLVRRIGTLNCGHAAFPIILGVNSPQYTPEELEQLRADNEKGVTVDGRHYTMYEATQMQRKLERAIRKQKRRILVDEAAGDKDRLLTDQIRLRRLRQEYGRFSKAAGLRTQQERLEIAGFGTKRAAVKAPPKTEKPEAPPPPANVPDATTPPANLPAVSVPATSAPAASVQTAEVPARAYADITGNWYPDATPGSHPVQDLHTYTAGGVTYRVDGHNVVLDYSPHEKEIAELIAREVGGEICMVPRVNNPQGVSTPDFLFHGKGYDLKTITSEGKKILYDRISKKKNQATNFIFDLSDSALTDEDIRQQIEYIYRSDHTRFVDELVVVKNGKIFLVTKRAKEKS